MKRLKQISICLFAAIVLISNFAFASELSDVKIGTLPETEEYQKWLALPEEEKGEQFTPKQFEVYRAEETATNPIYLSVSLGNTLLSRFSLKDLIPENMTIKNQGTSQLCWAFAATPDMEATIALRNYYNGLQTKTYDFSEKHMGMGTTRILKDGEINQYGCDKAPRDPANYMIARTYVTGQIGPVVENDMPFDDKYDLVSFSDLTSKKLVGKIKDTVVFPSYSADSPDIETAKEIMKNHIKTYGGIETAVYGASPSDNTFYNNSTGALYCNDKVNHPSNHAVLIVGWDDNYSKNNFIESCRPQNDGAWIVKNSWGTKLEITYSEAREIIFNQFSAEERATLGWVTTSDISDYNVESVLTSSGYTVSPSEKKAYLKYGDDGFVYISYEDEKVYTLMAGIEYAIDTVDNDYVYGYNYNPYSSAMTLYSENPEIVIANKFTKKSNEDEYVTEVAMDTIETLECEVYINPSSSDLKSADIQKVALQAGDTERIEAGYHTLEFAEPVKITGNDFAIIIKAKGFQTGNVSIPIEAPVENSNYSNIQIESGKCFWTTTDFYKKDQWADCADLYNISDGQVPNGDLTIKAFTVTNLEQTPEEPEPTEPEPTNPEPTKVSAIPIQFTNSTKVSVENARGYVYSDTSKKEYMELDVSLVNLTRSLENDKYEYYYYVSANSNEQNIENWVKINKEQKSKDHVSLCIDTRDSSNYADLIKGNTLYLYIKEVVSKGDDSKTTISGGYKVVNDKKVEMYKDGVKQLETSTTSSTSQSSSTTETTKKSDETVANKKIPNTGAAKIILVLVLVISAVGLIIYRKYSKLDF